MEKKIGCQQLLSSISEYIDGELSEDLCAEIEKHLQGCENCQIVLDTTRKTINLYQTCASGDCLPGDVHQRLFARLSLEDYSIEIGPDEKKDGITHA